MTGLAGRDRDEAGRARNARPRDALGRPLPRDATPPAGLPRIPEGPDGTALPPDEALVAAQQLLDDGYAFYAHEVLEATWKAAPSQERDLWQGLAQLAVGLTHIQRGNPRGARALLRRGATRIEPYASDPPHAVDVAGLLRWASELAHRLAQDPQPEAAPPKLRQPA
jgi:uncharacterized protein